MIDKAEVLESLKEINYPGFSRDIVSFGIVNSIDIKDDLIL